MAVSPTQVKQIVATEKSDQDIQVFIDTAELVVSEDLAGSGLSAERKEKIALWLSAHFLIISQDNGGIRRSKLGDADESYVVPKEQWGLGATHWGQQAMSLDTSGTLAASQASGGLKAEFRVVSQ